MNKIFSSVLLSMILLFLPISVFSFNTPDYITTGCIGKMPCHVRCNDVGSLYSECTVKTCTFISNPNDSVCDGTCNNVLSYDEDRACKFLCGGGCNFDCPKCRRNGPNDPDWLCENCPQ